MFSVVATLIYIPTNRTQEFSFLHILTNAYFISFFLIYFFNLHPSYLAYSATMISGVDSLMPLTHLAHPPVPTIPPATLCLFYLRLSFVTLSVFILLLFPFPYVHLFCVLKSSHE